MFKDDNQEMEEKLHVLNFAMCYDPKAYLNYFLKDEIMIVTS